MTDTDTFLLETFDRPALTVQSGRGCYLTDSSGRNYLDAITGIGVNALGHAHPRIVAVLLEQAQLCIHTSPLYRHPYQGALAGTLCAMSGMDRVFFSNSGTEAMETALKAVRSRGLSIHPEKIKLVALHNSFHGRTFGSLAITGQPKYQRPFEPLFPTVTFVEPNDYAGLGNAVSEETAGIIMEPVLGEGGIIPLEDDFLRLAREVATRSNALLVADEVQCGLGRTGRYFAYEWSGIRPDVLVLAKPLAAGLPLGATLFSESASRALPPGTHGTTFGGGPLACRVALEFLFLLEELLPQVEDRGKELLRGLKRLSEKHPVITEVRGKGLMLGIQLSRPGRPFVDRALERGLLLNCAHETVLRLLPPFILSSDQAREILRILDEVFVSS